MAQDRNTLFLKLALKNSMIDESQAEEVVSGIEQRKSLGLDRSAAEIAVERGFMTQTQATTTQKAVRAILPPDHVAGFELLDPIGRGVAGTVYRARQVSLDKIVAVKILHQNLADNPAFVEQFSREAKAAGRVNHPHVVQAIDAGVDDGYYYLAMELIEGETLRARVQRAGAFDERSALALARCIAQGLAHAHSHGLLHRDMKPDNILLGNDGATKIADLGLAIPIDDAESMSVEHRRMGTPYYMSPEQAQGMNIDEASELYALGATLYYAVTGKPLFTGESVKEILTKHVHQKPVPPTAVGARLSPPTEAMILDLLAKDPTERLSSASDCLARIDAIEGQLDEALAKPVTSGASNPPRSRKRVARRRSAQQQAVAVAKATVQRPASARPSVSPAPAAARRAAPVSVRDESAAPPSGRLTRRKNNMMSYAGAGVGVIIALVFLALASNHNQPDQQATHEEKKAEFDEFQLKAMSENRVLDHKKDVLANKKALERAESDIMAQMRRLDGDQHLAVLWNALGTHYNTEAGPFILEQAKLILESQIKEQRDQLAPYFEKAEELFNQDQLMDAVRYLDEQIPRELAIEPGNRAKIEQRISEIENEIDLRASADASAIQKAVAKKDYGLAISILEKIIVYADEERVRDARLQLAKFRKDKASVESTEAKRRVAEEERHYSDFIADIKSVIEQRDFKQCISKAISLQQETTEANINSRIETDLVGFQMLDAFIKDALSYIVSQKGSELVLTLELKNGTKETGTIGDLVDEDGKKAILLHVKIGGGVATKYMEVDQLTDASLFDLVERLHGPRSGRYLVPVGVYFLYKGKFDFAKRQFDVAAKNGVDPDVWRKKLEWLQKHAG